MHQTISPEEYTHYIASLCPLYHAFNQLMAEKIKDHLSTTTTDNPLIVNLGIGIGNLEELLLLEPLPKKIELVGFDHNSDALEYADKRLYPIILPGNRLQLNAKSISEAEFSNVEIVVASLALHHLNFDRGDCYKKIYRALNPNGIMLVLEQFSGQDPIEEYQIQTILEKNLSGHYSYSQWKKESRLSDHFWHRRQEQESLDRLGFKVQILMVDKPFYLYLARKTKS